MALGALLLVSLLGVYGWLGAFWRFQKRAQATH
jgi:hypothetical protein